MYRLWPHCNANQACCRVWVVPEVGDKEHKAEYKICACKLTKTPPYCDSMHKTLKPLLPALQAQCTADHTAVVKLCEYCGFVPAKQ